ncbi:MAG: class I SAM-dependent methyltransferase [Taibaiella sp.]|nr:class I SAM-dependent methyltransferase [Taibaiella sp.]
MQLDYVAINRALWDQKTEFHFNSEFYDVESFLQGRSSLNDIELALLGNVSGKSILHLQCHFGQDTLSLARLGASVTGVDLSEAAITKARELNDKLQLTGKFVCSDLYELPNVLDGKFDIVFTSYGTIGWLPDVDRWARVVEHYLRPGGLFVFADFHPVLWMFSNDFSQVQYSYFNGEPIVETLEGTYADKSANIKATEVGWNHGLAEVMNALKSSGLSIQSFQEYDYSPYNCFQKMVKAAPGKYYIAGLEQKLPMVYSLVAQAPTL